MFSENELPNTEIQFHITDKSKLRAIADIMPIVLSSVLCLRDGTLFLITA